MQRYIFTTDWHLRHNNSINRVGNIVEDEFVKVEEIFQIAVRESAIILHGGDLFNIPSPPFHIVERLIELIREYDVTIFGIPGNHDLIGGNFNSLADTAYGVLTRSSFIHLLAPSKETIFPDGIRVKGVLHQQKYNTADYQFEPSGSYKIIITHNLLTPSPVQFPHTLISSVNTNAHLVLCGDYHAPFHEITGPLSLTHFINPGCLLRQSISERNHCPKVLLFDKGTISQIKLERVKTSELVFKIPIKTTADEFTKTLEDVKIEVSDIEGTLETLGLSWGVSPEVIAECRSRIKNIRESFHES